MQQYSKEARLESELGECCSKIFCLLQSDTSPKHLINHKKVAESF